VNKFPVEGRGGGKIIYRVRDGGGAASLNYFLIEIFLITAHNI